MLSNKYNKGDKTIPPYLRYNGTANLNRSGTEKNGEFITQIFAFSYNVPLHSNNCTEKRTLLAPVKFCACQYRNTNKPTIKIYKNL